MTKEEDKLSSLKNREPKSFDISDLKDVQNNSLSTSKIWQEKIKRRKEAFQIKGINGNIFRISKAGRIVFNEEDKETL